MKWLRKQWHKFRGYRSFRVQYANGRINTEHLYTWSEITVNATAFNWTILFCPEGEPHEL